MENIVNVSIIIPAYNEELNIKKCVDTINKAKKVFDWEVIIIDDGSTDNTQEICLSLASEYSNVFYFRQENGGVSKARNNGIKKAKGQYVMFVDADDLLVENWSVIIDSYIHDTSFNVVQFCMCYNELVTSDGFPKKFKIDSNTFKNFLLNKNRYLDFTEYGNNIINSTHGVVAKLFYRELIEKYKIRFYEGISLGEDILFYLSVLDRCDYIEATDEPIYIVKENKNSSTRRYNPELFRGTVDFCKKIYSLYPAEKQKKEFADNTALQIYRHVFSGVLYNLGQNDTLSIKEKISIIKNVTDTPEVQYAFGVLHKNGKKVKMSGRHMLFLNMLRHNTAIIYVELHRLLSKLK